MTTAAAEITDDQLLDALRSTGQNILAAKHLGIHDSSFRRAIRLRGLEERASKIREEVKPPTLESVRDAERAQELPVHRMPAEMRPEKETTYVKGDEATVITNVNPSKLGDIDALIRSRGLDPEDWIVFSAVINEWDGMTKVSSNEDRTVKLHQLKIVLKRKVTLELVSPARHVPPLPLRANQRVTKVVGEPTYTLLEGDHQAPYHCRPLDAATAALTAWLQPERHIFIGDTLDLPTISRFMGHPAVTATPQECINAGYDILRSRAEASPDTQRQKLKGNHDFRLESEQLLRSERMYGVAPAYEIQSALDIRRLLHLEKLGIELVTDIRGWEHAEIELVPGPLGLVVSHGWMTGTNVAERSMKARGRSQIVGHSHRRELTYWWDPSASVERVGATIGCQCEVRGGGDGRYPHYAKQDRWLQGPAVVSIWQDGRFEIEHIRWDGKTLVWRNERFTA